MRALRQELHRQKQTYLISVEAEIREIEKMKAVFASVLLITVVVAYAKEAATQSVDPQSEGRTIVAQRFCPKGRC
jgi:hypothetical protein